MTIFEETIHESCQHLREVSGILRLLESYVNRNILTTIGSFCNLKPQNCDRPIERSRFSNTSRQKS
ncbi:MAG: hypothetical protein MUD14_03075 [Hydrococcus sp. Prado102]|nr:hypothetical protein [Hydrococcus sp. Prado102]